MPDSPLQQLAEEILKYTWQNNPVQATELGIHDYDHHYADYSPEVRGAYHDQIKAYIQKLDEIKTEALSLDEQVEHAVLRSRLNCQVQEESTELSRNPSLYPSEALLGVQQLQINYSLPVDQRVLAIMGRLKDMPRFLSQGIENLRSQPEKISQISVSHALDALRNGKQFLEEILPQFSGTVPQYFKDLLEGNTVALKAMHQFEGFLHDLKSKASSEFACGREHYEFLLHEKHMVQMSVEDIVEYGEAALAHTEKLLKEVAQELDPEHSWQEQLESLQNQYPQPEHLLHYYKSEAERIRDFGIDRELYTLPETETLMIMETPIFQRSIMPYSGYVSPAPFESHQTGYFWVTPMHDRMSEEEVKQRLRAHNIYDVILTNVHHAYPGQHLLFVRTNGHPSKVRKSYPCEFFASGWPMYCEEMLYTEGLYTDLKTRLFQLKDQFWRECRLILDVKLHLGQMSYEEAVQMLIDKVGLDEFSAQSEIKRYILFPTVAAGYMLGKREIVSLRQEVAELEGDDFSLKHFHDTLLSFGSIPMSLGRQLVLEQYKSA